MTLMEIDPLDEMHRWLMPKLIERMVGFAREHMEECDPVHFVRTFLARLTLRDANVVLLAAYNDTHLVGHSIAALEGSNVVVYQTQVEPKQEGLVQQMIEFGKTWGQHRGATHLVMATTKGPLFQKKYGFKTLRYLMSLPLTNGDEV
jgi:hypothetical protein